MGVAKLNYEEVLLASGARTATTQSLTMLNHGSRGVAILLDLTNANSGQINSLEVQALIGASTWVTLYQFAAVNITTNGGYAFLVYPGAATAGSWKSAPAQGVIPYQWRVQVTHNAAQSMTYALTASYVA